MPRSKVLICLAAALIAGSVVASWIAIGRVASATQRGLARTEQSLSSARDLAADTAASASELQRVTGIVGEGLSSTADALVATRQVSASVRGLLDVATVFTRVEDLADNLTAAEVSIARVEIDLAEAAGSIEEATPVLDEAITSLRAIPGELDRSIAEVKSSRTRIGQQVWLWRLAIVAGAAALLIMLALIRSVSGPLGVSRHTPVEGGQP